MLLEEKIIFEKKEKILLSGVKKRKVPKKLLCGI